jgi:hypothetical protein
MERKLMKAGIKVSGREPATNPIGSTPDAKIGSISAAKTERIELF